MERIQNLATAVGDLRNEGVAIRLELRRRTTLLAWLFVAGAVVLTFALFAAYTVSLNNQAAIQESNRKWCPMVALLIPAPGESRASTQRGKDIETNARELYTTFGCGTAR